MCFYGGNLVSGFGDLAAFWPGGFGSLGLGWSASSIYGKAYQPIALERALSDSDTLKMRWQS